MGLRGPKKEPIESAMERGVYKPYRHGEAPLVLGGRVLELGDPPAALVALDVTLASGLLVHRDDDGNPIEIARQAPSAVEAWRDVAGPLTGASLVQANDLPALEMMAAALHTFRLAQWELELHLRATGKMTYRVGTNGALAPHPSIAIRDRAAKEFQSWCARFGATPSDRVSLGIGAVKGRTMEHTLEQAIGESPRGKPVLDADPA